MVRLKGIGIVLESGGAGWTEGRGASGKVGRGGREGGGAGVGGGGGRVRHVVIGLGAGGGGEEAGGGDEGIVSVSSPSASVVDLLRGAPISNRQRFGLSTSHCLISIRFKMA